MINMIFIFLNINIVCCFPNFILIYDKKKEYNFFKTDCNDNIKLIIMIRAFINMNTRY